MRPSNPASGGEVSLRPVYAAGAGSYSGREALYRADNAGDA